jgi:hypothetical protein
LTAFGVKTRTNGPNLGPARIAALFRKYKKVARRIRRKYIYSVIITFGPAKRDAAVKHRALDFADAARIFDGDHATWLDDRTDYGEVRQITAGRLDGRMIVFVRTEHVISMRHCHTKEERKICRRFGF